MNLKSTTFTIGAIALLCGTLTAAPVSDDFTSGLENWTPTLILDNGGAETNTTTFQVNDSDQLEINTTVYDNIEQYAFLFTGAALEVGEEAQIDLVIPISGNRNLGLYVGGTAPTEAVAGMSTREDFITAYLGSQNARVFSRGFNGITEYGLVQQDSVDATTIFIARTETNTFEIGYYNSLAERTVTATRTPDTPNTANFVGIYADTREAGIVGAIDAFRIINPTVPPTDTEILITGFALTNNGQYVINFTGSGNQTFIVKKSSNLQDGFTTEAATDAVVTTDAEGNGQAIITNPIDILPTEFYRIESSP